MFEIYVIHHFTIYKERGEDFRYDIRCLEVKKKKYMIIFDYF